MHHSAFGESLEHKEAGGLVLRGVRLLRLQGADNGALFRILKIFDLVFHVVVIQGF